MWALLGQFAVRMFQFRKQKGEQIGQLKAIYLYVTDGTTYIVFISKKQRHKNSNYLTSCNNEEKSSFQDNVTFSFQKTVE